MPGLCNLELLEESGQGGVFLSGAVVLDIGVFGGELLFFSFMQWKVGIAGLGNGSAVV